MLLHKIQRLRQYRLAGVERHIEMEHVLQLFGMGFGIDLRLYGHALGAQSGDKWLSLAGGEAVVGAGGHIDWRIIRRQPRYG